MKVYCTLRQSWSTSNFWTSAWAQTQKQNEDARRSAESTCKNGRLMISWLPGHKSTRYTGTEARFFTKVLSINQWSYNNSSHTKKLRSQVGKRHKAVYELCWLSTYNSNTTASPEFPKQEHPRVTHTPLSQLTLIQLALHNFNFRKQETKSQKASKTGVRIAYSCRHPKYILGKKIK